MRLFLTLSIVAIINSLFAQHTISGTIYDIDGLPAIGANIVEKGTTNGTASDFDGKFTLDLSASDAIIVFSSIGLKTQEIQATPDSTHYIIYFEVDSREVKEVVKMGYLVARKEDATAAITSVRGDYPVKIRGMSSISSEATPTPPAPALLMVHDDLEIAESAEYSTNNTSTKAGMLTAGEVNDFSKWELWNDIVSEQLKQYQTQWKVSPKKRYTIQLQNTDAMPVIDAKVTMLNKDNKMVWSARTDNTGKAELWPKAFDIKKQKENYSVSIEYNGITRKIDNIREFHKGINTKTLDVEYKVPEFVDIAFVVDATGSMGDEIRNLKAEMQDIIRSVKDSLTERTVSIGSVFYRDTIENYLTKPCPFSTNVEDVISFMNENGADGGGDRPEAVSAGLETAINTLEWHPEALSRIIFLVLDAPPHDKPANLARLHRVTRQAALEGIRIVPLTCSGIDKSTEYIMRSLALLTNGTYSFLTDDSGIGNPHIKPTTDEYDVEKMNDLLKRIIYQFTHVPSIDTSLQTAVADTSIASLKAEVISEEEEDLEPTEKEYDEPETITIEWKYYPNPTSGVINIESNTAISELFVTDVMGKIVKRYTWDNETEVIIDISEFPQGIYHLTYEHSPDKLLKGQVIKVY